MHQQQQQQQQQHGLHRLSRTNGEAACRVELAGLKLIQVLPVGMHAATHSQTVCCYNIITCAPCMQTSVEQASCSMRKLRRYSHSSPTPTSQTLAWTLMLAKPSGRQQTLQASTAIAPPQPDHRKPLRWKKASTSSSNAALQIGAPGSWVGSLTTSAT